MTLTPEQLEARRHGIGGSDVPAILGLSPWRTPLDVYLEKTGEGAPAPADDSPDTPIYWGNVLEDLVAREYSKRTGHKVRRVSRQLRHKEVRIATANIDRLVVATEDGPGVLECKTARVSTDDWGEPGTDEVPDYYLAQVVHYLAVTGHGWADLAVLFLAERRFAIYHIRRDDELVASILDTEQRWWREHVEARVPPPPMSAEDMARMWPKDNGSQVVATPSVEAACRELAAVKAGLKKLDEQKAALESEIKGAIGEASALVDPAGRPLATWKASKPSKRIDWPGVVETLAARYGIDEAGVDEAVAENTIEMPGSRRFYLKVKGGE